MKNQKYDIIDAMCKAMHMIGIVEKGGHNGHMNYKFASETDILKKVQPALTACGIGIEKHEMDIIKYELVQGKRQKWHAVVKVTADFVLSAGFAINAENMRITQVAIGAGEDHSDKAVAKAQTMAFKYLLRNAFAIPTGDDPDMTENSRPDYGDPRNYEPQQSRGSQRQRRQVIKQDAPKQSITMDLEAFKKWASTINDYQIMSDFCAETVSTKTPPEMWTNDQLSKFKEYFEKGNLRNGYNAFIKDLNEKNNDDRQFPPDQIDMSVIPF